MTRTMAKSDSAIEETSHPISESKEARAVLRRVIKDPATRRALRDVIELSEKVIPAHVSRVRPTCQHLVAVKLPSSPRNEYLLCLWCARLVVRSREAPVV